MCKKEQANTGDGEIWLNATFLRPQRFNIDELEHHVIIRSRYRKMIMEDTNMKKTIFAEKAPAAVGHYVHAVEAGNMVFTSGQLGLDPENGTLPEGIEAQTHQALKNLGAVLEAAGVGYEDVVRTMVFLDNMDDFATVNAIYAEYFKDAAPARSCVEVARLPKGGLIEIEAIAAK